MKPTCTFCRSPRRDVESVFLRVIGGAHYGIAGVVRWINLRCPCCADCYQQGRAISSFRIWAMLLMQAPFFLCLVVGGILYAGFGLEKVAFPIIYVGALLWFVGFFILMPLIIAGGTRRRIQDFLDPDLEDRLLRLGRLRGWGLFKHIALVKKLPKREGFIDLDQAEEGEAPEEGDMVGP